MDLNKNHGIFRTGKMWIYLMVIAAIFTTSCMTIQDATNKAISTAVGNVVERNVSAMMSGYTSMMLYQLAYTQAFHVGGFGIHPDYFTEGEGTIWKVEAGDDNEMNSYTAERALLKRDEDGSSWWYLNYQPEGDEALEYEIKMNRNLEPLEMYMRNVNTGEIDHHVFDNATAEGEEAWESERELEEEGYQTDYYFLQEWEEYRQGTESVRISGRSYESDVLAYTAADSENNEQVDFTWWVSENAPGYLVKYEFTDRESSGRASGQMIEHRQGYQPRFVRF